MVSLRQKVEEDLAVTLEGDWALPVVLIDEDGVTYDTSENDGNPLGGQIIYDTLEDNPDFGAQIIVHKPVVSLRRSSLTKIPQAGERWIVKIPRTPDPTAPIVPFLMERPSEDGQSIGFIRLYLMELEQSS